MRSIPPELTAKVRQMIQTDGYNARPHMRAIVTRHTVLLKDYDMWQTTVIPGAAAARASIAARRKRADKPVDAVFVGYVTGGAASVQYGVPVGINPPAAWTGYSYLPDATDIALAFEGQFTKRLEKVEFTTLTAAPWVFWVNAAHQVCARTPAFEDVLLGTDAVAVAATMGAASIMSDVSEGLVLVIVSTGGAVVTRQLLDGVWSDGAICAEAPAGVVDASISRTWDYRLCLHLRTSDGKVWELLGRSMISGNANTEQITAALALSVAVTETTKVSAQGTENIGAALALETGVYETTAPAIVSAENLDDGAGNWGLRLRVRFDRPVYGLAGNAAAFVLAGTYPGEAIVYDTADPDKRTLLLTMADFNNSPVSTNLAYTPGTLASGPSVTPVAGQSLPVVLTGLVPTAPPSAVSAAVVDNRTIDISFSEPLSSADVAANAAALSLTGFEPLYSPGGPLQSATYALDSVMWAPEAEQAQAITVNDGALTDLEVS